MKSVRAFSPYVVRATQAVSNKRFILLKDSDRMWHIVTLWTNTSNVWKRMRFLLRCILTFNLKTFFIEILPRSRTKRNLQRQRVFLLYHCKRIARWRKSLEEKYTKKYYYVIQTVKRWILILKCKEKMYVFFRIIFPTYEQFNLIQ